MSFARMSSLLLTENRRDPKKEPYASPSSSEAGGGTPSLFLTVERERGSPEPSLAVQLQWHPASECVSSLLLLVWIPLCTEFPSLGFPSPLQPSLGPVSHVAAQRSLACAQQVSPVSSTAGWAFCNEIF